MTPAEEGAYIRLLAIAWGSDDCGLPDDDNKLAVLSRLNEGWFNGGSRLVRECFFSVDGRLYNQRLLDEHKKQEIWREKSSRGGKISGKSRRAKKKAIVKGGSLLVEPNTNTSSSSSNSTSSNTEEGTINTLCAKKEKVMYGEHVLLSSAEYKKLTDRFGKEATDDWIERMNLYAASKPQKFREYKSHYATILNWDKMQKDKDGSGNSKRPGKVDLSDDSRFDEMRKRYARGES
jgi:uncharacterized protein YdaU (DUF1376 family)